MRCAASPSPCVFSAASKVWMYVACALLEERFNVAGSRSRSRLFRTTAHTPQHTPEHGYDQYSTNVHT